MRTTILRPTDAKWTTATISSYNFGEALQGLFPMGGENDEEFRLENIVRLSTSAFKIQFSTQAFEYMRSAGARPFNISPFGTWAIAGGATPPCSSLVVAGIPEDLDKMEVATALVVGHGAHAPRARPPACTRAARATAKEAGAVGRRSGRGSYGTREQERCGPCRHQNSPHPGVAGCSGLQT